MLRTEQYFPCSSEAVQSLFFNEQFIHSKFETLGVDSFEIHEFGKHQGQQKVFRFVSRAAMGEKVLRHIPLPKSMRKYLNAKSMICQETEWQLDDGDIKHATHRTKLEGMPVEILGDITIRPNGSGCIMEIQCQPDARIPLVGGVMNKLLEHLIDRNLEDDYEFNQDYIQNHIVH